MVNDYLYIDFPTYEKYFVDALKAQNPMEFHAIFYEKTTKGINIYFSWNVFKIKTSITYDGISALYDGQRLNIADIVLSDVEDTDPLIRKFHHDYLLDRGIPLAKEGA